MREDARGIIDAEAGLRRFRLDRFPPSSPAARFVDRYWVSTWDLAAPYVQRVFSHPVVNVVFEPGGTVHGPTTRVSNQVLEGAGRVLGVMFRPAGFRPFLGAAMSGIVDGTLDLSAVFDGAADLADEIAAAADPAAMAAAADRFLCERVPPHPCPSEPTSALVERIAADPAMVRVEDLAAGEGIGVRQLQRRFTDHVGISPKAVIRRYRLYEAAERARKGADVPWAALAVELGYSDQSHLTREFTAVIGTPPDRYARTGSA
ncbi:AraC family transcriptional regulator [Murinocardiopsis flavida]|uniref:AraC family transcriptional regulator n=1 Tax=Murinocardiopsis flavida TaxID=645275 RepID=A0A2P8DE31_9ACTN|nr:AraC family transcriptional regulator [Murinocardiopsis flavida]